MGQYQLLGISGRDPVVLDLGAGTTVEIWIAGITAFVAECHHHGRQIISHKSHVV